MTCYDPKKETQHRNRKIETLETSEFHKSVSEREDDHDKLRNGKYNGKDYRRDTSEFICADQDTNGRYLIEEPSYDIWLGLAFEDRIDIAYHRRSDTHCRKDQYDEKNVYFKSRGHRDMKKYLFVFVSLFYRIIDELVYKASREYEYPQSDEE